MAKTPAFAARASIGNDISIRVLFFPLAFLAGCGSSGGGESGTCPAGQVLRYESPGCGVDAKPVCGSKSQDACYRAVCSCQGETISRCDYASEPFAYFGACPIPDGAGPDIPPSVPDTANDVSNDLAVEAAGPDMAIDRGSDGAADRGGLDGGIDGPPVGPTDLAIDIKSPVDGPAEGGSYDSGPCPAGQVLRYETPGCGSDAKPVCGSAQQDACARPVCSCRGVTISRCDYAPEPYASAGACVPYDGGLSG